jgi:hypothetical protein
VSAALRSCRATFAHAVHELSAEPTGENVVRYLMASRELERAAVAAREAIRRPKRARRRVRFAAESVS